MTKIEKFATELGFYGVDYVFSLDKVNYYFPYYKEMRSAGVKVIKEDEKGEIILMTPDESSLIVSMYNNPNFKKYLTNSQNSK